MKCPKCTNIKLRTIIENNIEVDFCESCGGVWFDRNEFEKMTDKVVELSFERAVHEITPFDTDRMTANCPVCHIVMEKIPKNNVANLTIDQCMRCKGIWLDRGEFYRLSKEKLLHKIKYSL